MTVGISPAVFGIALFISGLGMSEDCWRHRQQEDALGWIFALSFVLGGLGLVAYEVNYWLS